MTVNHSDVLRRIERSENHVKPLFTQEVRECQTVRKGRSYCRDGFRSIAWTPGYDHGPSSVKVLHVPKAEGVSYS